MSLHRKFNIQLLLPDTLQSLQSIDIRSKKKVIDPYTLFVVSEPIAAWAQLGFGGERQQYDVVKLAFMNLWTIPWAFT